MKCKNCNCVLSDAMCGFSDWHISEGGYACNICACGCKEADSGQNICEWCAKRHPKGFDLYYTIVVYDSEHKICGDCFKHLKKVNK